MNKPVKYTLLGLLGLLVLVIGAVAIFAATFDPNKYKGEIERLAKEKTGRTLAIKGEIKMAFWPSLGADVAGVSLTEKGSNEVFAAFDSVHASVKLMPLLHGAYQVDAVKLTGAKARVVKLKNGKFNFSDLTEASADKSAETKKPETKAESGKAVEFDISSVDIERASIQYIDQVAGQEYAIEDFKLKTGRLSPDAKGKLELAMVAKRKAPALTVKLSADGNYAFKDGVLSGDVTAKLDDSTIKAKFTAAEPYNFEASIDKLNVDRYLGEPAKPQAQQAEKAASSGKKEEDAPVDLSGLKDLNAKGKLTIGELQVRGLKVAEVNAQLNAEKGRVAIAPHSAKLYEGTVTGEVVADANHNAISLKEQLKGVAIGPLLRDVAQRDQLEGKGDITLDVTAAGKTVNAMKKSLAGTAKVHLADGAIKGINLAEIIEKGRSLLGKSGGNSAAAGESANDKTRRTDFSELAASFQIKNGVAHNEDLDVKAPLFRLGGNGNIDLGESKLDYTAKASVVATSKGQGGKERTDLAGLTVPVHLTGPLDDLKYQVDYRAMASGALKSEAGEKLKERVGEQLKSDKVQEKLKGLLGR